MSIKLNSNSFIQANREVLSSQVHDSEILTLVKDSSFLILGAAGTIGQAVTKEIFKRNPKKLHCVDISENNLNFKI